MARPLRIEFVGALYHVTARGHARQAIFLDDEDRHRFLGVLGQVVSRFHLLLHAYCLMDNHFHLVVETPEVSRPPVRRRFLSDSVADCPPNPVLTPSRHGYFLPSEPISSVCPLFFSLSAAL